jgi:hypothetical protein
MFVTILNHPPRGCRRKRNEKKKHAFIVGIISLLGIYFSTLAIAPDAIPAVGPAVVAGIIGSCGSFLGANVADNWQRSKYYQPALDNRPPSRMEQ